MMMTRARAMAALAGGCSDEKYCKNKAHRTLSLGLPYGISRESVFCIARDGGVIVFRFRSLWRRRDLPARLCRRPTAQWWNLPVAMLCLKRRRAPLCDLSLNFTFDLGLCADFSEVDFCFSEEDIETWPELESQFFEYKRDKQLEKLLDWDSSTIHRTPRAHRVRSHIPSCCSSAPTVIALTCATDVTTPFGSVPPVTQHTDF